MSRWSPPKHVRSGFGIGLLVLVLSAAIGAPARAQGVPEIASITIDGNKTTESSLILSRFPLSPGDRLVGAIVREGLKDLYGLGLFTDVEILGDTRPDGRVDVTIRVQERMRVSAVRFVGNDHLDADELKERTVLGVGQLFDPARLEAARQEVLAAYREEGYPLAEVVVEQTPVGEGKVSVSFRVTEGERVRLRKINFLGNAAVEGDDLRDAMKLRPKGFLRSGRFEQAKLEEDLQRIAQYYHDNGYRDATVKGFEIEYSDDRRDIFLNIEVDEGPLYTLERPQWTGNEAVKDELIASLIPWEEGAPYSEAKIADMNLAITEAFTERGYLLGFGVSEDEEVLDGHRVAVTYTISEGEPSRIGEIRISGNTRTKEKVIRRELAIYPGDVFRRSLLARSQREVFALGYFDDVQVGFDAKDPQSNVIDLEMKVKERRLGTAGAGMGFSSATGLTGFIQIGHNNLFGNGWAMNVHLERGSRRSQYEFSFTEPWFMDRPISLGFELFDTELSRDVFDDRRRGLSFTVGWPFPGVDYTRAFATFSWQKIDIPFVSSSLSQETIDRLLEGTGSILSIRVGASRNTTDNPFYPESGSRTNWSSELTGGILGGHVDFQKHLLDHRTYLKPFWKPVVMFRGRFGVLQPYVRKGSVPGYETFRLGGTLFNYLRGYDDYDVVPDENIQIDSLGNLSRFPGGKFMATMTMEYQFSIAHPLHGLLFLDAGDTWNALDDISLNDFKRGAGFGLRMEVPMLGILGLDYAYGFDRDTGAKWKPHLIFGRQF